MAGPEGERERERAGEEGEYHHSRNLMKKMAVGRRTFKEERRRRGEERRRARRVLGFGGWEGSNEGVCGE